MSPLIVIVTVAALLLYFVFGFRVGIMRARHKVEAPAMTGHPDFERAVRIQANTLEWLVIFLPLLWIFADLVSETGAAILGVVWVAGRILYAVGYTRDAAKRRPGFGIQALATLILLVGSLGAAVWALATGG